MKLSRFFVLLAALAALEASAESLRYSGELVECSAACDEIRVLDPGNASGRETRFFFYQYLGQNAAQTVTLPDDAVGDFQAGFHVPFIPTVDPVLGPSKLCPPPNVPLQLCNFNDVNPWPLSNALAHVTGGGRATPDGSFDSGVVTVRLTQEPFLRNDTALTIVLVTGSAVLTMINGAVTLARFEGQAEFLFDSDLDGINDAVDNCLLAPNASQYDSNEDGFGNACDADVNNDCIVNAQDLGIFRRNYFTLFPDIDFNGDGIPGVIDLGILRSVFFTQPGPSALADCESIP